MPRTIDYYFSLVSPWAYIGHAPFMDIARAARARHQLQAGLPRPRLRRDGRPAPGAAPSGAPALSPRGTPALARQARARLQHPAEALSFRRRRLRIASSSPSRSPTRTRILSCDGRSPRFGRRSAISPIRQCSPISRSGPASNPPRSSSARRAARARRFTRSISRTPLANDVFGSPAYVLDGEVFWGQDRLELLDDALSSGRQRLQASRAELIPRRRGLPAIARAARAVPPASPAC